MKRVLSLSGGWIYSESSVLDPFRSAGKSEKVNLPFTVDFSRRPVYSCIYRKEIPVPTEMRMREMWVEFDGICGKADIFVDENLVCTRRHSPTRFRINITPFIKSDTVAVLSIVLSSDDIQDRASFYSAGIFGEARLIIVDTARFALGEKGSDGICIRSRIVDGVGKVNVSANIDNPINYDILSYTINASDGSEIATVKTNPVKSDVEITVPDALGWTPQEPNLYTLVARIIRDGRAQDVRSVAFGFRNFEYDEGYLLNGEKTTLKGYSFSPYRENGLSSDASADYSDVCMIKELGGNFVRCDGYPGREFIDCCDENGVLVAIENNALIRPDMTDSDFEAILLTLSDIAAQTRNNPSVVMLCLGKVIVADEGNIPADKIQRLVDAVKSAGGQQLKFMYGYRDERLVPSPASFNTDCDGECVVADYIDDYVTDSGIQKGYRECPGKEISDDAYLCKLKFADDEFTHICKIDYSVKNPVVKVYSNKKDISLVLNDKENKPVTLTSDNGIFTAENLKITKKTRIKII